jgi:hypothetical protein
MLKIWNLNKVSNFDTILTHAHLVLHQKWFSLFYAFFATVYWSYWNI